MRASRHRRCDVTHPRSMLSSGWTGCLAAAGMAGASCTTDNRCESCRGGLRTATSTSNRPTCFRRRDDDAVPGFMRPVGFAEAAVAAISGGRRSVLPGLPVRGDWPAWNGGRDEGAGQVPSRGRCRVDRVRSTAPVAAPTGSLLLGQGRRVAMPPIRACDASARSVADRIEGSRSRCREAEFWTHYGTRNSR